MGFDDLWEKYGQKKESGQVSEKRQQEPRTTRQPTNKIHPKSDPSSQYQKETPRTIKQENGQNRKEETKTPMTGVFGTETDRSSDYSGSQKKRNGFDWDVIRGWPWIDIIFITITIIMIVGVIVNFERVTTALFYTLLPLLSNILELFIIIGVIACAIWWFNRRSRR